MLDHLATHVDAKPLLEDVQLVAIKHVPHRKLVLSDEPHQIHGALEAQRNRLEVRRADGRIAGEKHRRAGEWVVAERRAAPLPTGCVAGPVQDQRYPDDFQVAEHVALRFQFDLVDEPIHGGRDLREVAAKPLTVEFIRHPRVLVSADDDNAGHVADIAIVERPVDRRNEFIY